MTDRIALALGALIGVILAGDVVANDATLMIFLTRKLVESVEFLAFWR